MKKLRVIYGENEISSMVANFVGDWITPYRAKPIKIRNSEEIKKFVLSLEGQS
jgi:hypothetical protein